MDFYTVLSSYYDDIFEKNEKAIQLIRGKVPQKENARLLDLAAGTGEEAIALAKEGFHVTATDMNENMVEIMKSKIEMKEIPLVIKKMDMGELAGTPFKNFDGIYCIGNSFVHLKNKENMIDLLNAVYEKLNTGGVFVMQIVNYDRVLSQKITHLPVIVNQEKGLRFERFYKETVADFRFQMRLTLELEGNFKVLESETSLTPLTKEDLVSVVDASSFNKYDLFGSFKMTEYTTDSPALVAVLTKR
ncbi:class I SAM-dependent DNA methyltransferase [Salipaludibacillus sp. HK11]|uniref:class I SAM-dependent DNA methyltransferase n=1 Tax=Salipaludibacillus sp. HK11 TaxID=3394320 RepID=UPI0039FCCACF